MTLVGRLLDAFTSYPHWDSCTSASSGQMRAGTNLAPWSEPSGKEGPQWHSRSMRPVRSLWLWAPGQSLQEGLAERSRVGGGLCPRR